MEKLSIVRRRKRPPEPSVETPQASAPQPAEHPEGYEVEFALTPEQARELRATLPLEKIERGEVEGASLVVREAEEERVVVSLSFRGRSSPQMLTPTEVCEMLKVGKGTLASLIKGRRLRCFWVGKRRRFDLRDVLDYLSQALG